MGGPVKALVATGNSLYVGGDFVQANIRVAGLDAGEGTVRANNVARWGTYWSAVGNGNGNGVNGSVGALAVVGSDLYVGGAFTKANVGGSGATPEVPVSNLAKWMGTWVNPSQEGYGVSPTLGNYPPATVNLSGNLNVTPDATPLNTIRINVSASTDFKGTFAADPATGVVRVTNAHPAGTFTVTVRAFDGPLDTTKTFTLTVATGAACADLPSLTKSADVSAIWIPHFVAVGDFNNDGKQDIAIAFAHDSSLRIALGDGAGGFSSPTYAESGGWTDSLAIGDFNNDGNQDIACTFISWNHVGILLGNGAGGFSRINDVSLPGGDTRSVAIADFNEDGRQDLAVAHSTSSGGAVSIRLGNGQGGFSGSTEVSVGGDSRSVAIGDFDGDGKPDFVTANYSSNTVSIRLGNGTGGFSGTTEVSVGGSPYSVAIGDFNEDGKQDIAVANSSSGTVSVRLGNGTGGFSGSTEVSVGNNPVSVALGDFNRDGKQDIAVANQSSNSVSIRWGNGLGGFSGSTDFVVGHTNPAAGGDDPDSLATADFNNDGRQDLVTANYYGGNASIFLGKCNLAQTITFGPLANKTFGDPDFAVSATASSGLEVSFAAGGQCTIAANTVHLTGAGACTITASQSGDANYNPATNAQQSFTIAKANQTITFDALANKTFGDPDFTVSATASSGLAVSFAAGGQCTIAVNTVHITGAGSCTVTASQSGDDNYNPAQDVPRNFTIGNAALITFSQADYPVNESDGSVTVTVNRTGDLSVPVSVDYATDDPGGDGEYGAPDGWAWARCDFGLTLGTLTFAPGETHKTFVIPINQDSYTEGPEMFMVNLSNLTGPGAAFATPASATVTIDDSATPPNIIDDTATFVRMHYHDFLNREPDPEGLAFWTDNIDKCNDPARRLEGLTTAQCIEVMRINTSAAFFLSIEFQQTALMVRSFYVAALDRPLTENMPAFAEFECDTQAMQRGVIVGQGNWRQTLNDNRDAFSKDFVSRPEFVGSYPTTETPAQYVDKLYLHANITPPPSERDGAIAEFGSATTAADAGARGRALLDVTQNLSFQKREMNRSLVQMEYFGYLRRNPNDAPDENFDGFNFWLNNLNKLNPTFADAEMVKTSGEYRFWPLDLNQFNANFMQVEMIKAFLSSIEYRQRFGP